jgi:hypothetical protein
MEKIHILRENSSEYRIRGIHLSFSLPGGILWKKKESGEKKV